MRRSLRLIVFYHLLDFVISRLTDGPQIWSVSGQNRTDDSSDPESTRSLRKQTAVFPAYRAIILQIQKILSINVL